MARRWTKLNQLAAGSAESRSRYWCLPFEHWDRLSDRRWVFLRSAMPALRLSQWQDLAIDPSAELRNQVIVLAGLHLTHLDRAKTNCPPCSTCTKFITNTKQDMSDVQLHSSKALASRGSLGNSGSYCCQRTISTLGTSSNIRYSAQEESWVA